MITISNRIAESDELEVEKSTKNMILFKTFVNHNPHNDFHFLAEQSYPSSDELYYESLRAQLVHVLHKYSAGWLTSERQLLIATEECISTVQFILNEEGKVSKINAFLRSSNLKQYRDDVTFFNAFIKENYNGMIADNVELDLFVSMPHVITGGRVEK